MKRFFSFLLLVLLLCVAVAALWVWKNPRYSHGQFDLRRSLAPLVGRGSKQWQPEKYTVAAGPYVNANDVNILAAMSRQRVLLARAVVPSVVSINTTRAARANPHLNDPLFKLFHRGVPMPPTIPGGTEGAQGSGAIVSKEGHIVTNNHVIEGMDQIEVELSDGRRRGAVLVGTDPDTDIAILKIDADGLQPLPFGNSDEVEVGETVMAVGNPYGLEESVTQGIISAKGRTTSERTSTAMFQTDTAINPGNSGGPLVNVRGELIGINEKIYTETGGWQGVGFAIPSATVRRSMDSILATGRVLHGYLGIERGLTEKKGVLVDRVRADSPAEKADIHPGDLIQRFNGKAVADIGDLRRGVEEAGVNAVATVELLRDGKGLSVQARIVERPAANAQVSYVPNGLPPGVGPAVPGYTGGVLDGVTVAGLTPAVLQRRGLPDGTSGVLVEAVDAASPAAGDLRPGDIIDGINNQEVATVGDYQAHAGENVGEPARLSILRGQTHLLIIIQPG